MSPLSTERVHIYLARHEVCVLRVAGRLRKQVTAARMIQVTRDDSHDLVATIRTALAEALAAAEVRHSPASIVLSSRLAHMAAAPANNAIALTAEQLAYAEITLRHRFGNLADNWQVSACETGSTVVAAAVDEQLLEMLREVLAPRRLQARTVTPIAVAAFNALRRRLHSAARFVVVESDCATVVRLDRGTWSSVQVHALRADPARSLGHVLDRDNNLAGTVPKTFVYCASEAAAESLHGAADLELLSPRTCRWLGPIAALGT